MELRAILTYIKTKLGDASAWYFADS